MVRFLGLASLLLFLVGCATTPASPQRLTGRYIQSSLSWGSATSLYLEADGTYLIGDEVVECVPNLEQESEYGISYARGRWTENGGVLQLVQTEAHQGNFMSTGDYGNLRFTISRSGKELLLTQRDAKSPLVLRFVGPIEPSAEVPADQADMAEEEQPRATPAQTQLSPR